MPTIEINKKDLEHLCKKKFSEKTLIETLELTKVSVEKIEKDNITVKIEDTNRADLLSVEGIARAVKGIIGKESGLVNFKIEKSNFLVKVNPKVKKVRPFTVCAVIKNLNFSEEIIEQLIQLQEKLSETFGKKRKEAAIGVYDFDKIKWPIKYTTYRPDSLSFTPLGLVEKLSLKRILEKHEKGQTYGHLLKDHKEYPIFIDAEDNVLSMPPIINSDYSGKVTKKTKNIFIEVSGFNREKLNHILNIIVLALAERGGKIYSVKIRDKRTITTPDFTTKIRKIKLEEINSLLGLDLKIKEAYDFLNKLRYDVRKKDSSFIVDIPCYRQDVIHNVDLIEDIAIAYGYKNFKPIEPPIYTIGSVLEETKQKRKISEILIGLGYQEILSFILSNKKEQFEKMNIKPSSFLEIVNPVSETFSSLRKSLISSILKFFSNNTTKDFPQKIFEIGKVLEPDQKKENKSKEETKLCIATSHAKANFTEIVQVLDYLMKKQNLEYKLEKKEHLSFILGRTAEIKLIIKKDKKIQERTVGIIGEVRPKVIDKWNLRMPVSLLELDFDVLFSV